MNPWKSDIEVKGSKLRLCVLFGWSVEKHVSLRIIRREDSSYVINVIFVITTETINHLSLHCPIAVQIWQMIYSILDMNKAMPRTTSDLLKCWKRKGMKGSYTTIWNTIPTCIWRGIWKLRNGRISGVQRYTKKERALWIKVIVTKFSELNPWCSNIAWILVVRSLENNQKFMAIDESQT